MQAHRLCIPANSSGDATLRCARTRELTILYRLVGRLKMRDHRIEAQLYAPIHTSSVRHNKRVRSETGYIFRIRRRNIQITVCFASDDVQTSGTRCHNGSYIRTMENDVYQNKRTDKRLLSLRISEGGTRRPTHDHRSRTALLRHLQRVSVQSGASYGGAISSYGRLCASSP